MTEMGIGYRKKPLTNPGLLAVADDVGTIGVIYPSDVR